MGRELTASFGQHKSLSRYLNGGLSVAAAGVGLEASYNPQQRCSSITKRVLKLCQIENRSQGSKVAHVSAITADNSIKSEFLFFFKYIMAHKGSSGRHFDIIRFEFSSKLNIWYGAVFMLNVTKHAARLISMRELKFKKRFLQENYTCKHIQRAHLISDIMDAVGI